VKGVIDDYYGQKVADAYRYMENLKDPEVGAWFKAQNDYTRAALDTIPGREKLLARIRELDQSVPRVAAGRMPGDVYMIWKLLPDEDVAKIYLRNGLKGTDRLLVDPAKNQADPGRSSQRQKQHCGRCRLTRRQADGDWNYSRRVRDQTTNCM